MRNISDKQPNARYLAIADRLAQNASTIQYGVVSVELQIHDNRICNITYSTTERTRNAEK